jgi:hypothetical protein
MPDKRGRTGKSGNDTSYKHIGIKAPKPDLLQPGKSRSNMSPSSVVKHGSGSKKGGSSKSY